MSKDPVIQLREEISATPLVAQPRPLPEVPSQYQNGLSKRAIEINQQPTLKRLTLVAAICYENARLLAEVNTLRAALGFEQLPSYDPTPRKNGR